MRSLDEGRGGNGGARSVGRSNLSKDGGGDYSSNTFGVGL